MEHMHADERFKDMTFKVDEAEGHAFKKCTYVLEKKSLHLI